MPAPPPFGPRRGLMNGAGGVTDPPVQFVTSEGRRRCLRPHLLNHGADL
jgi:hypothetical protein